MGTKSVDSDTEETLVAAHKRTADMLTKMGIQHSTMTLTDHVNSKAGASTVYGSDPNHPGNVLGSFLGPR